MLGDCKSALVDKTQQWGSSQPQLEFMIAHLTPSFFSIPASHGSLCSTFFENQVRLMQKLNLDRSKVFEGNVDWMVTKGPGFLQAPFAAEPKVGSTTTLCTSAGRLSPLDSVQALN